MPGEQRLITPQAAAQRLPHRPSAYTVWHWAKAHPGLGLKIAGRCFLFEQAVDAIGRGVPIAEAAKLVRPNGADQSA